MVTHLSGDPRQGRLLRPAERRASPRAALRAAPCARCGRCKGLPRSPIAERRARREMAAHAVHAAARRRRRRAHVEAAHRRRVGIPARRRARHHLPQRLRAAVDVAAHQVLVAPLEVGRQEHVPLEDAVAEPGSEALDLRLDARADVERRSVGARGSRPTACADPPARASSRRGWAAPPARTAAPDARRARPSASASAISAKLPPTCTHRRLATERVRPRHRAVEREIDLADARSVAEAPQPAPVRGRQPIARDAQDLRRREVEEHRARRRQLVERAHAMTGLDRRRRASGGSTSSPSASDCAPPRGNGQPTACASS